MNETSLSKLEQKWITDRRFTRLTDNQEALIYPMGAERYLSSVLLGQQHSSYPILNDIKDKNILVIPGYGNTAFLFAQAGAKSITVCDKDPVTIAWVKAFKKYYHYRQGTYPSIGELLEALTNWYPPLLKLPTGFLKNALSFAFFPNSLRRTYIFYMIALVIEAITIKTRENFELESPISFYTCELNNIKDQFDTAYVPYLLGVSNGIERERDIVQFIKQLIEVVPQGRILITPSLNAKEFHVTGKRYFKTTTFKNIKDIPGLKPYFIGEDISWFKTQGLGIFGYPYK